MTGLLTILRQQIQATGPITVAEFMAQCLLHEKHGYYATRDPFGRGGDFITAPEISQMFGELIGLSLAQSWIAQGTPALFTLAEAGPGRGTLMADILRATAKVSGFHQAMQVHLIELSPALKKIQQETLHSYQVTWLDHVEDLPDQPLFLVANEFFDALPTHQFQRSKTGWRERCVGLNQQGELCFGLSDEIPYPALVYRLEDTKRGELVEFNPAAIGIARSVGERINRYGGAALFIDYGDWRSLGDTLQAIVDHVSVDPLATPGQADLTTHVDFEALARCTPSEFSRLTTQGVFLERLGITDRAKVLAKNMSKNQLDQHIAAHRRLTHPSEMGTVFKTMAFFPKGQPPPPGLEQ